MKIAAFVANVIHSALMMSAGVTAYLHEWWGLGCLLFVAAAVASFRDVAIRRAA